MVQYSAEREVKKATEEMEEMLRSIDTTLRSRSLFDSDPPNSLPPRAGGDDSAFIAGIA